MLTVLGTAVPAWSTRFEVSVPSAVSVPTSVVLGRLDAAIVEPALKPSTPGKSDHVLVALSPDQSCA